MWRGPAWNSMTYWAALGCMRYDRLDAASAILEAALDASAANPKGRARSGSSTIRTAAIRWICSASRKPTKTPRARDYLGHNPLIAMARLWQQINS